MSDLREHRGLGMQIVSKIKVGDATAAHES